MSFETLEAAAYELGCEAANSAATWITDGGDTDESRRRKLEMIDKGILDHIISYPNLSGEWADDPTPLSIYYKLTSAEDRPEEGAAGEIDLIDALAEAYEHGVSDTFEDACIAELNRWLYWNQS